MESQGKDVFGKQRIVTGLISVSLMVPQFISMGKAVEMIKCNLLCIMCTSDMVFLQCTGSTTPTPSVLYCVILYSDSI